MIPLHKKVYTENPSNYRPILVLSIFSKIFEKVMHKRLYEFLEKNNLLYSLQFGFRSKHSTSHTLISMTEKIKNTIDNGNYGCGIFIDLKKASDTVNHSMLLRKLNHMVSEVFHSSGLNLTFQIEINMFQSMVILQSSFLLHMVCHKGQCLDHFYF